MAKDDEKGDSSQNQSKQQNAPKTNTQTQDDEAHASASSSLASRIQNSASGLARNAFSASGQSQDLAGSLASSEKARPSGSTTVGQSSGRAVDDQFRQAAGSSSTRGYGGIPGETFRSSYQQNQDEMTGLTDEQFQGTYDGHDIPASVHGTGKGKERASEDAFDAAWHRSSHPASTPPSISAPTDGAAVVSLLSDSTFSPDFPNDTDTFHDPDAPPAPLTPAEIDMLKTFQRHLPPPPSHQHRLTSSSLVPDIDTIFSSASAPAAGGSETDATALRDYVLTGLPGAAEWMAVEERYHDEVWGYLRPTLEAAAKEMDEKKDAGMEVIEDGPAVRRLKMILKHM